jgi:hypothetical protein
LSALTLGFAKRLEQRETTSKLHLQQPSTILPVGSLLPGHSARLNNILACSSPPLVHTALCACNNLHKTPEAAFTMSSRAPNPTSGSRKISFNVSEQYDIQDVVGEGAYGVVWYVDGRFRRKNRTHLTSLAVPLCTSLRVRRLPSRRLHPSITPCSAYVLCVR